MNSYSEKIKEIWKELDKYQKITIFTHIMPDGDTIGTAMAFKELILKNLKDKEVKIAGAQIPKNLQWVQDYEEVTDEFIKESIALSVDTSSIKRVHDKRILNAIKILKVDHHHPEDDDKWFLKIDGDNWAATGEVVYDFVKELNLEVTQKALEAIYVAIWTDTSGLKEREPSSHTFEAIEFLESKGIKREEVAKKLDISDEDKKVVEYFISNATVENGLVYKVNDEIIDMDIYRNATERYIEKYDGQIYLFAVRKNDGFLRVGLRSKEIDISTVASHFGGGGHKLSAGCQVAKVDEVEKIIRYTLNILEGKSNE